MGNNLSETMVAMETQPVVEPVKTEVSPDAGRRAETSEARVETRDVERWRLGEEEEGRTVFVSNLPFSTTEN